MKLSKNLFRTIHLQPLWIVLVTLALSVSFVYADEESMVKTFTAKNANNAEASNEEAELDSFMATIMASDAEAQQAAPAAAIEQSDQKAALQATIDALQALQAAPTATPVPSTADDETAALQATIAALQAVLEQQNSQQAAPSTKDSTNNNFHEDFGEGFNNRGWETMINLGNPNSTYTFPGRNLLSFRLPSYATYVYQTINAVDNPNVKIEATFENINSGEGSYSLICRYSGDTWYEFRVYISGIDAGSYRLLKYDAYLREQGKNPYNAIHKGMDKYMTVDIKLGVNRQNKLGMICNEDLIEVFINDKKQLQLNKLDYRDSEFTKGTVGFGAQSYGSGTVQVDILDYTVEAIEN